jgi:hypothetical protein
VDARFADGCRNLGRQPVPSASTITATLQRHGRIDHAASAAHQPFERAAPNELRQIDYKGHFANGGGALPPADGSRRPLALRSWAAGLR